MIMITVILHDSCERWPGGGGGLPDPLAGVGAVCEAGKHPSRLATAAAAADAAARALAGAGAGADCSPGPSP